jgi:hypothetical protein
VGDIMALKTLKTVVPACGQVNFGDPGEVGKVRRSSYGKWSISVGIVLLDMRKGKWGIESLDKLSYLPWERRIDTEVGLT